MSHKYKFNDQSELFFVSYAVVGWVDLFVRNEYKDVIVKSLQHCIEHKGLEVYAWCIMTAHVHVIIGTHGNLLQDIIRDHKKFTSEVLKNKIRNHPQENRKSWLLQYFTETGKANSNNDNFQLWQQNNHPVRLSNGFMLNQKLDYLHLNPVRAGFVVRPEDWLYSSARDYYLQQSGLLDGISLLEPESSVR